MKINIILAFLRKNFDNLILIIKENVFDVHVSNLEDIPEIEFPDIQKVKIIEDNTENILRDLNEILSRHLIDIKDKIVKPQEIDLSPILKKLDSLVDPNITKEIEKLLIIISKKGIDFSSIETQLKSIGSLLKKTLSKKDKKVKGNDYSKLLDGIKKTLSSIYVPTFPKVIGINNIEGTRINPATEDTLEKLIGFEIPPYDYVVLTYVSAGNGAGKMETAVYKTGGSSGDIVTTLTLAYNSDDKVNSITKT